MPVIIIGSFETHKVMIFLKTIILLRAFFKSRPCVSWYGSCRLVHNGNRYQSYYHVKYTKYSLYKTNIRTTNSLLLNKAISDKYGLILQYILQKYSTILRRDLIFNIKLYKNNRKISSYLLFQRVLLHRPLIPYCSGYCNELKSK